MRANLTGNHHFANAAGPSAQLGRFTLAIPTIRRPSTLHAIYQLIQGDCVAWTEALAIAVQVVVDASKIDNGLVRGLQIVRGNKEGFPQHP